MNCGVVAVLVTQIARHDRDILTPRDGDCLIFNVHGRIELRVNRCPLLLYFLHDLGLLKDAAINILKILLF